MSPSVRGRAPYYMIMRDRLRKVAASFDIWHFHIDAFPMPLFRVIAAKTLTTLRGRQNLPDPFALRGLSGYAAVIHFERPARPDRRREFLEDRLSWAAV